MSTDLQLAHWPDHLDAGPGCPDGSGATLWTSNDTVGGMPCSGGLILDLSKAAQTWIEKLWGTGSDVDGPLRVRAIAVSSELDDPAAPTASLGFDLGPYAVPWETGLSLELDDPAALASEPALTSELRSLRPKVAAGEYAGSQGNVLPVRQNGVLYWVFFRDTIPLENASGLVRPPD